MGAFTIDSPVVRPDQDVVATAGWRGPDNARCQVVGPINVVVLYEERAAVDAVQLERRIGARTQVACLDSIGHAGGRAEREPIMVVLVLKRSYLDIVPLAVD